MNPVCPQNAYASEGFSMVGFLWKLEAASQISEGREQVMKSDWGRGIVVAGYRCYGERTVPVIDARSVIA